MLYLIARKTTAHSAAEAMKAAASLETTGIRRIDQVAACAGCGEAGPWRWTCECPWSWPW